MAGSGNASADDDTRIGQHGALQEFDPIPGQRPFDAGPLTGARPDAGDDSVHDDGVKVMRVETPLTTKGVVRVLKQKNVEIDCYARLPVWA